VECETHFDGPWSCVRLKYEMTDYWTGEPLAIDDKIFLATSRPPFGGLRWWFVCPRSNRRVRKLYLPLGGRHFWSRRAYALERRRCVAHEIFLRRERDCFSAISLKYLYFLSLGVKLLPQAPPRKGGERSMSLSPLPHCLAGSGGWDPIPGASWWLGPL
jgi:hypothetical protein